MGKIVQNVLGVWDGATGKLLSVVPSGSTGATPVGVATLTSSQQAQIASDPTLGTLVGTPEQNAALTFEPIAAAAIATTSGTTNESRQIVGGPDDGARLIWSIPSGETLAAWCWWLWPQSKYEG